MGNPGSRYSGSYHNVGYRCLDRLIDNYDAQPHKTGPDHLYEARSDSLEYLGKPDCYVNESGSVIKEWSNQLSLDSSSILVIYDDFSLECGELRIRPKGGPGGHNGMSSIISQLSTKSIPRIRIGIGPVPSNVDPTEFVLEKIYPDDRSILESVIRSIPKVIETVTNEGIDSAMNHWNGVDFRERA